MSESTNINERRKFTRIPFEASVSLSSPDGSWTGKLLDISLNGILITRPHNWLERTNKEYLVEIHCAENTFQIQMEATITHSENDKIGLQCNHIDIDSASHLRRLIELNIGDENILNREISALVSSAA